MPEIIPLIVNLVGGGGGSVAPKAATPTPAETAAAAGKTKQNQITSLEQAFPGIQSLTGGSLSPEAVLRLAELITGKAGEPGIGSSEQDILKLLTGNSNPLPFMVSAGNNPSGTTTPTGLAPGGGT